MRDGPADAHSGGHPAAVMSAPFRHDVDAGLRDGRRAGDGRRLTGRCRTPEEDDIRREIQKVEGPVITHYHFDHTDGIVSFQQSFDCPCLYGRAPCRCAHARPTAWRLPCLAPETIRVDQPMRDGQFWAMARVHFDLALLPGSNALPQRIACCRRRPAHVLRRRFAYDERARRLLRPQPQLARTGRGLPALPDAY